MLRAAYGVGKPVDNALRRLVPVTGYGQERDGELALEAGFDEHIVKPIDLAKLDNVLMRATHT